MTSWVKGMVIISPLVMQWLGARAGDVFYTPIITSLSFGESAPLKCDFTSFLGFFPLWWHGMARGSWVGYIPSPCGRLEGTGVGRFFPPCGFVSDSAPAGEVLVKKCLLTAGLVKKDRMFWVYFKQVTFPIPQT